MTLPFQSFERANKRACIRALVDFKMIYFDMSIVFAYLSLLVDLAIMNYCSPLSYKAVNDMSDDLEFEV